MASRRLFRTTSSTQLRNSLSIFSYIVSCPGLTIPIVIPALIAWYKKTECIASRIESLPLKENEKFDTPPLIMAWGKVVVI